MNGTSDLAALSPAALAARERAIARRYMGKLSLPMVVWPFVNTACWLALWPLALSGVMPLWAACAVAFVNVTLAYLPSHEAQHDIYARPGEKLRWLNQSIGHLSLIPLALSYRLLRETHMEHHKNTNHPDLDPDYLYNGGRNGLETIWRMIRSFQPGSPYAAAYTDAMERLGTPEAEKALRDQALWLILHNGILFVCAFYGLALEALLLWWLPLKAGSLYIRYYLSWLPHRPGREIGRYRDTREFSSWLGVWSSLGMTAHIVHHLYPRIPLDKTPAAMRALYPILQARGCDLLDPLTPHQDDAPPRAA